MAEKPSSTTSSARLYWPFLYAISHLLKSVLFHLRLSYARLRPLIQTKGSLSNERSRKHPRTTKPKSPQGDKNQRTFPLTTTTDSSIINA
jgi:hypothetical protein